jgi:hypothetical protein
MLVLTVFKYLNYVTNTTVYYSVTLITEVVGTCAAPSGNIMK